MINKVKEELTKSYSLELVNSLLESYEELAGNFVRGKLRPSQVEGGRFCEAVIRMLQHETTGNYTPIGTPLNLDLEIETLKNLPKDAYDESIRLIIPRTVRVIYDVRSKRDIAHLGNINSNMMDATLVLNCCKWILAELFRTKFQIPIEEAQQIINNLVEKEIPVIQDFAGFPVILNSQMSARERILVLLYNRGNEGTTKQELAAWLPPKMQKQLTANLSRLQHDRSFIHRDNIQIYITRAGEKFVEDDILPHL